ncbi:DinB family protein [Janibacter terrae]|jgi:hypothetical protein|uniref:DinB family protein n=1 Tax=Janibacter terrae TaxID=103817 RepID=A0ABZ2FES1_9MICO
MTQSPQAHPDIPPWEPPVAGTDAEQVVAALDRQRATFRWKADGLDETGLAHRVGVSELSLGGLLNHLAFIEDLASTHSLDGTEIPEHWGDPREPDRWSEIFAPSESAEELYARYDDAVARARTRIAEAVAAGGLDQRVEVEDPDRGSANLRRLLLDLLEEYGRHTGHADLIRESVDGRTGEDPPDDWAWPPA